LRYSYTPAAKPTANRRMATRLKKRGSLYTIAILQKVWPAAYGTRIAGFQGGTKNRRSQHGEDMTKCWRCAFIFALILAVPSALPAAENAPVSQTIFGLHEQVR